MAAFLGVRDARLRWRAYAGIAVLVGVTAGLSLFAIAGARRTQSSYPRLLRSVRASTLAVSDFGAFDPTVNAAVAHLPNVRRARTSVAFETFRLRDGKPDFSQFFEAVGSKDGAYFDQDRFSATHGRRPDPSKGEEVAVNELAAARYGYRVGERLQLGTYDAPPTDVAFFSHPPPPKMVMTVTVVGVGAFPEEVLQDDADRLPRILLTPAYTAQAMPFATYGSEGLALTHGDRDISALKRTITQRVPAGALTFHATAVDEVHTLRAIRPVSVALGGFGLVAALAGLVLVAQAMARVVRSQRETRAVLRALGAGPRTILQASLLAPLVTLIVGAVSAIAVATGLSPLMPTGRVRRVEPRPGLHVDVTVLVLGALVFVVVPLAAAAAAVIFDRPGHARHAPSGVPWFHSINAILGGVLGAAAVTGARFALRPAEEGTPTTRSSIAGAAVAVAALVASITFGASLTNLVDHPKLYGWGGEAAVLAGNGYGNIPLPGAHAVLDRDQAVQSWSGVYFGHGAVDGTDLPLLGMDPGSAVVPPLTSGRFIADHNEAVLGRATARGLHKRVGDELALVGPQGPQRVKVVGIATLPAIGLIHAAHTSLGDGMVVAHELVPGYDQDITGQRHGDFGPRALFVRFRSGTNASAEISRLQQATGRLAGLGGVSVLPVQRPAEITSSKSVSTLPVLLAAALGLATLLSFGLALGGTVRRRRRDIAVLKTIGFTRPQLHATVSWLAVTTAMVALIIGVPVGVVLGRTTWNLFAEQIYVVDAPSVPVASLVALVVAAIGLAAGLATVPSRRARRTDVATTLRVG